jgi:hypothetical protein
MSGMMQFAKTKSHSAHAMNATRRDLLLQRWNVIKHDLTPEMRNDVGPLAPKLEKVVHILELD